MNIEIKKKDLWILSTVFVFLFVIGLAISYGDYLTGNPNPNVLGHTSDEINVKNKLGNEVDLQNYIDNLPSSNIQHAQAYRKDGPSNNRPISLISGPSSAFVALDNVRADSNSIYTGSNYDGIKCNSDQGWKVVGCWEVLVGDDGDIYPYPNGCVTNDFDGQSSVELSIICIKF